jgi:putative transposase
MRRVFYAGDALSAKRALERFGTKWKPMYPDAVKCLQRDFEAVTAYLAFPELEWMHLRTTNLIERLHKEFKRRTKPFVAMKMEVSWRNAPFRNSGFRKLKPFAGYFTHKT